MKKVVKLILIGTTLLVTLCLTSCWWYTLRPIQPPYITRKPPYVVILQFPYRENEKVLDLVVKEEIEAIYDHTYNFQKRWQIKAIASVPAKNFKVEMGVVPSGFKQVYPTEDEKFVPLVGEKYIVEINTTTQSSEYRTWWAP